MLLTCQIIDKAISICADKLAYEERGLQAEVGVSCKHEHQKT